MKVSVIVPVFNAEKFLGACLESLANQTLKDFLERFGGRLKILRTEKNSGNVVLKKFF
ncbi:MAG: glycosyltransferase [Selenomonadaceae bacterium]|nr:glycosyltransferase [Selenomonadaceae bacterium]MBQ9497931.1 glycosyltransferase [Selenomonadaceae bacterium]